MRVLPRAHRSPPRRIDVAQREARTALGALVSECRIAVRWGRVRVVPQRGHDEVGVLDGRHAGRYGPGGHVKRGVGERQCEPGSGPVRRGRVGGESRGERKKLRNQVLACEGTRSGEEVPRCCCCCCCRS